MFSLTKLAAVATLFLVPALAAPSLEARSCAYYCASTDLVNGYLVSSTAAHTTAFSCIYQDSSLEKRTGYTPPPSTCSYNASGALLTTSSSCPKSVYKCVTPPPPPPCRVNCNM